MIQGRVDRKEGGGWGLGAIARVRWGGGGCNGEGETGMGKRGWVEVLARAVSGEGKKGWVRLGGCNREEEGGNGKGKMGREQQERGDGGRAQRGGEKKGQEERGFHRWIC